VLPSGQKLTLGLLATFTLKVVPYCTYAPFPALLPFFKCILQVVFCESVQHGHSASITSIVSKQQPYTVIFYRRNREKSPGTKSGKWDEWGTTVMLFLVNNSLVKEEVLDGALL
jgi:hypothetical protein